MPDIHARFSPSSADRLIHCPPSLVMGEQYGNRDESSVYAEEGTEAHSLCEYLLRKALGQAVEDPRPGMKYYSPEMQECAEGYRDAAMEIYETAWREYGDAIICIEQRIDFSNWVKQGFGTSDCIVVGGGKLFVIDFKYGKGVSVSAEENSQLKCYALGAYSIFSPLYEIDEITLVIYQPRISNYSRWSLSTKALLAWADEVLRPAAEMALSGKGDLSSGSWCRFCKAKAVCRKRAEENLALARYEFADPAVLEDEEINRILAQIDDLVRWAEDVKAYALSEALRGKVWDDWKVVEGRANRKYLDEKKVAEAVEAEGIDPFEKKLLSVSSMEKLLGKKRFQEILGDFVYRPAGKPALVSRDDKRPEMTDFD